MPAERPIRVTDIKAVEERESRIQLALLRGVVENLKTNRMAVPVFGLAIAAMFQQWVSPGHLLGWYGQMVLGLGPQAFLLSRFPATDLSAEETRSWTLRIVAANLFFVANWASLGVWFWAGGNASHLIIEMILAASLAAHAATTGAARALSRPAMMLYLIVLTAVPLQGLANTGTAMNAVVMALLAPFYVGFTAMVARRSHARAKEAAVVGQERDSLLTELVMAKLESDRGREQAEAASLAKSQFLANMSHELRTPLNAILGFSEMIASRIFEKDPERNVEYAQLVNSSGKHLLALINDILDLAKIEAGRWKLAEAALDLHRVTEDAMQFIAWRAKDSNATLVNSVDSKLDLVYGDERAIKQILLNLLSNAVKFTPEHGTITAFARRAEDGGMLLGVSDTGVGIAAEDQQAVFDSFGQGRHDVAMADRGTGLGLAIVKGLVEAHGGDVSLESQVGKGTHITLHLPAAGVRPRDATQQGEAAWEVA